LAAKTGSETSDNSASHASTIRGDRSLLPCDAWKTIAESLRISDRELQIVQAIFDDRKELAIAQELTISVHTVHSHLERLYRKLGVSSRVGLVLCIVSKYLSLFAPVLKRHF
jgi:DNA-binding NarL/FixJ family response regulator